MDLTSVFGVVLVRMAGASDLRRKAGAFIFRESVVSGRESWARSCGVEAISAGVRGFGCGHVSGEDCLPSAQQRGALPQSQYRAAEK